ncbi:cell wall / vacuolar inhibitor of fructosidase 2-like [Coffea eugenioides]|uniref:Cell wall / vacuolar inhibitor of fructosidase 2-like n=1 Tax=Coffea arabica TaxID=13443 RepID=A0ABM4V9S6_COFAR|nr:cell wall / vacuolar inhibitor of fructosidase 2-like [Coffea eugenioides]
MSPFSLSFLLLPLALFLVLGAHPIAAQAPAPSPSSNANALISTACEQANHKDFCIHVLKSDRNSPTADIKGLAYIVLRLAEKNATATSLFIKQKLNSLGQIKSDLIQQSLMDCADHYITASELVEDAISSLVSGIYNDASQLAKAAVADLDSCDAGIKEYKDSSPNALEVVNKNQLIRQLINTGLTIAHVAATAKAH